MSIKPTIILTTALAALLISGSVLVNACKKNDTARYLPPTLLSFDIPDGFPEPVYGFTNNPLTEEGFVLGRKLFHDPLLSKGTDVSCSSCHQQHAAYTTFDHDLGHGTNMQHTTRNVPVLFNLAWAPSMQWDGSVGSLEEQPLVCLNAPEKMGLTTNELVNKLRQKEGYPALFGKAFGTEEISGRRVAQAITQFIASLVSANSRYDRMKKGEAVLNASEQQGYAIFQDKCATCHTEPLFTDWSYRNTGLPLNPYHTDLGRMEVTNNPIDSLKFKVPTLRNIALTGYFGHDGRFIALSQMLDHYSTGIQDGPTLDPSLKNKIPLTDLEKFYLQEFLYTLTDSSLINNERFAAE